MCSIIYHGNINKDTITLSYFLLCYYIVTHSYCVPTLYLLVSTLASGAPHVASCDWPYSILTHSGGQFLTWWLYIYIDIYIYRYVYSGHVIIYNNIYIYIPTSEVTDVLFIFSLLNHLSHGEPVCCLDSVIGENSCVRCDIVYIEIWVALGQTRVQA